MGRWRRWRSESPSFGIRPQDVSSSVVLKRSSAYHFTSSILFVLVKTVQRDAAIVLRKPGVDNPICLTSSKTPMGKEVDQVSRFGSSDYYSS